MKQLVDAAWRGGMRVGYRLQLAWWRLRRPVIQGAYVAVWHRGRVLVIQNSYRRRLSLPAGGLARGETPREAARRELAEEVGIEVDAARLHYRGEFVERGIAEDHAHLFELELDEEPRVRVDRREVIWAELLEPRDAIERGVVPVVRRYLEGRGDGTEA